MGVNITDLDVRAAVAMMRELGVTKLKAQGVEIELSPLPEAPPTITPTAEDVPEPEAVCVCGHPWLEHNEAGCGNGCSLERCGDAPQREPTT